MHTSYTAKLERPVKKNCPLDLGGAGLIELKFLKLVIAECYVLYVICEDDKVGLVGVHAVYYGSVRCDLSSNTEPSILWIDQVRIVQRKLLTLNPGMSG